MTFVIGNTSGLQNSKPTFTASYTGSAIDGVDISSILAGLAFTVTPSVAGPGTYTITATGTAPSGYSINVIPGTLTIVGSSPQTLPTQVTANVPVLPILLASINGGSSTGMLQPVNSVGLFAIDVSASGDASGVSFIGFSTQETPLAQSSFFGSSDRRDDYTAGAKP